MSVDGEVPAVVLRPVAGLRAGALVQVNPNDPVWRGKIAAGSVRLLDPEILYSAPDPDEQDQADVVPDDGGVDPED